MYANLNDTDQSQQLNQLSSRGSFGPGAALVDGMYPADARTDWDLGSFSVLLESFICSFCGATLSQYVIYQPVSGFNVVADLCRCIFILFCVTELSN